MRDIKEGKDNIYIDNGNTIIKTNNFSLFNINIEWLKELFRQHTPLNKLVNNTLSSRNLKQLIISNPNVVIQELEPYLQDKGLATNLKYESLSIILYCYQIIGDRNKIIEYLEQIDKMEIKNDAYQKNKIANKLLLFYIHEKDKEGILYADTVIQQYLNEPYILSIYLLLHSDSTDDVNRVIEIIPKKLYNNVSIMNGLYGLYKNRKDYQKANYWIKKAYEKDSKNPVICRHYIDSIISMFNSHCMIDNFNKEKLEEIIYVYTQAKNYYYTDEEKRIYYHNLGFLYSISKQFKLSEKNSSQALEIEPYNENTIKNYSASLFYQKKYKELIKYITSLPLDIRDNFLITKQLYRAYLAEKSWGKIYEILDKYKDNIEIYSFLSYLRLCETKKSNPKETSKEISKFLEQSVIKHNYLLFVQYQIDSNFANLIEAYTLTINDKTCDLDIKLGIAYELGQVGNLPEALTMYDSIPITYENCKYNRIYELYLFCLLHCSLPRLQDEMSKWQEEDINHYKKRTKGIFYMHKREFERSENIFKELVESEPENKLNLLNLLVLQNKDDELKDLLKNAKHLLQKGNFMYNSMLIDNLVNANMQKPFLVDAILELLLELIKEDYDKYKGLYYKSLRLVTLENKELFNEVNAFLLEHKVNKKRLHIIAYNETENTKYFRFIDKYSEEYRQLQKLSVDDEVEFESKPYKLVEKTNKYLLILQYINKNDLSRMTREHDGMEAVFSPKDKEPTFQDLKNIMASIVSPQKRVNGQYLLPFAFAKDVFKTDIFRMLYNPYYTKHKNISLPIIENTSNHIEQQEYILDSVSLYLLFSLNIYKQVLNRVYVVPETFNMLSKVLYSLDGDESFQYFYHWLESNAIMLDFDYENKTIENEAMFYSSQEMQQVCYASLKHNKSFISHDVHLLHILKAHSVYKTIPTSSLYTLLQRNKKNLSNEDWKEYIKYFLVHKYNNLYVHDLLDEKFLKDLSYTQLLLKYLIETNPQEVLKYIHDILFFINPTYPKVYKNIFNALRTLNVELYNKLCDLIHSYSKQYQYSKLCEIYNVLNIQNKYVADLFVTSKVNLFNSIIKTSDNVSLLNSINKNIIV